MQAGLCPKGHDLVEATADEVLKCDGDTCRAEILVKDVFYTCVQCDFDRCKQCSEWFRHRGKRTALPASPAWYQVGPSPKKASPSIESAPSKPRRVHFDSASTAQPTTTSKDNHEDICFATLKALHESAQTELKELRAENARLSTQLEMQKERLLPKYSTKARGAVKMSKEGYAADTDGGTTEGEPTTHDPGKNHQKRLGEVVGQLNKVFDKRPAYKLDALNYIMLHMSAADRATLRELHAMQQERYLEARRVVRLLETQLYNAQNSLDLRVLLMISMSMITTIRDLTSSVDGERLLISRPPKSRVKGAGDFNPLTRPMNRRLGIKDAVLRAPFVFKLPEEIKRQMALSLGGAKLYLASEAIDGVDAAAWDFCDTASRVLRCAAEVGNLRDLKPGELRVLQLMFDAHGWTSRAGLTRFVIRTPHTVTVKS